MTLSMNEGEFHELINQASRDFGKFSTDEMPYWHKFLYGRLVSAGAFTTVDHRPTYEDCELRIANEANRAYLDRLVKAGLVQPRREPEFRTVEEAEKWLDKNDPDATCNPWMVQRRRSWAAKDDSRLWSAYQSRTGTRDAPTQLEALNALIHAIREQSQ